MEGKLLVKTCTLSVNEHKLSTHVLIDCAATGNAFIDQDFVCPHHIPNQELKEKREVKVIDKRPIESGDITHMSNVGME